MMDNKRFKKLAQVAIGIAVIAGAVVVIMKYMNNPLDVQLIDKAKAEYLVMNVPSNYVFHVERKHAGDLVVCDLDGKTVETRLTESGNTIKVKPPSEGYEVGEVYTLDISDIGSFSNKGLEKAKRIMFVIKSKDKFNVTYTDRVKERSDTQASVKADTISLQGTYSNGDIVLADTDEDGIQEIYKLGEVSLEGNKTTATYSTPEADEVYKDLDIFYYGDIDADSITIDEDKLYGNLEEIGILDIVFDEAYAADKDKRPTIKCNVKKKDKGFQIQITVKYPDNPVKIEMTSTVSCKTFYKNKNENIVLNNTLTLGGDVQISVEGELGELKEKEIRKAIEKFVSLHDSTVDAMTFEAPIVPIKIALYGPIYLKLDLGLKGSLEIGGRLELKARDEVTITRGLVYDYSKVKVIKKYCEVEPVLDASVTLEGRAESFAGFYANGEVVVPLLVTAGVNGSVGPYFDVKGCAILQGIPSDTKLEGYYNVEAGIKYDADCFIELLKNRTITIQLADKKLRMWAKSNGQKLKEVDFPDSYTLTDGKIQFNELHATYHDVIENRDNTEAIEAYQLYINGSRVKPEDGFIPFDKDPGEYTFKLKWEKDNIPFEYERKIKIEENLYAPERIQFLTDYLWQAAFSTSNGGLYFMRFNGDGSLDVVHAVTGDCYYGTYVYSSDDVLSLSVDTATTDCNNERFKGNEVELESIEAHTAQDYLYNYRLIRIDDNEEYFEMLQESDIYMAAYFNFLALIDTDY